jgi:hypothetical protein
MKTKAKKKTAKKSKSIKQEDNSLITIILLCDNPGYRMKSYGPISLIDVTSTKKLIDLQIEAINKTFPNCEIIVCLGFDCEKVCKYIKTKHSTNIRIVENQMYAVTNSCESLRLCLNNTGNDKILICDGSLLFDKSIISLIDKKNPCVILESEPNQTLEIGVNVDKDIAYFFSFGAKYIWSEIMFLAGKEMIESFRKILSNSHNKTKFVFEAINELINMKYEIRTVQNKKPLYKINSIKTYHNIKGML